MKKYNFETRELVPYNDDWNVGGNVIISGALWYYKANDAIYLVDNKKVRSVITPNDRADLRQISERFCAKLPIKIHFHTFTQNYIFGVRFSKSSE